MAVETITTIIDRIAKQDPAFYARMADFFTALKAILASGLNGQSLKIAFGTAAFTTTGTTKEVSAYTADGQKITTTLFAFAHPKAAWAATELMFMDGVVDGSAGSETTTVSRIAGTTSGLGFWYFIIGT